MALGFFAPADPTNPNATLEELSRRQAYADLLTKRGGASTPKNWHEGLAAGVDRLIGGIESKRLNKEQSSLQKDANAHIAKLLMGGQGSPLTPTGDGGFAVTPGPAAGPEPSSPAGGSRAASEIQTAGGLDPTSRDLAIRTMLAEGGGEGIQGLTAVGHVLKNRVSAGRYGGNTIAGVVRAPNQFEPWNTPEGRTKIAGHDPNSSAYKQAGAVVDAVFGGQSPDPTGGATHFFAPVLQGQLGRNAPAWAKSPTATIGGHSFYAPEGRVGGGGGGPVTRGIGGPSGGGGAPVAAPDGGGARVPAGGGAVEPTAAAAPTGGMSPERRQAIVSMLTSGNPYAAQAASPIVAQLLQREMTPQEYGFTESGGRIYRTDPRTGNVTALTDAQTKPATTEDMVEYEFAKRNGFAGSFMEYLAAKRGSTAEKPVWELENINGQPFLVNKSTGEAKPHGDRIPSEKAAGTPWKLQNINGQGMLVNEVTGEVKPSGAPIPPSLSATDRKEIFKSEDEIVNLEGTLAALGRAKELNPKTFLGSTAGARGWFGSNVPGGGIVVDEEAAKATQEWKQIMGLEAIQAMSNALKGATTEFELKEFTRIMADPATPVETRGRMIDRMLTLAQRRLEMNQARVNELRGGTYWKPGGGGSGKDAKKVDGKPSPQSVMRVPQALPDGATPEQALDEARRAIAAGRPREAVIEALKQYGIDPSGL